VNTEIQNEHEELRSAYKSDYGLDVLGNALGFAAMGRYLLVFRVSQWLLLKQCFYGGGGRLNRVRLFRRVGRAYCLRLQSDFIVSNVC